MMYLDKFNEKKNFTKNKKYQYLDEENSKLIYDIIYNFVNKLNINEKINNLKYEDFQDNDFYYLIIFENILTTKYYAKHNIFYVIDSYCREKHLDFFTPALRNTIFKHIKKVYNDFKLKKYFDERLVKILEDMPENYKDIFNDYSDLINNVVKKRCEWMLIISKYNL